MHDRESELVKRLKQKSTREEAFRELVKTYQEPLYHHIRRMVENHQDADDVLQNTFIKSWRFIDGFRAESKLYTWLYRIASNEALSFIRSQKARPSGDSEAQHHTAPTTDGLAQVGWTQQNPDMRARRADIEGQKVSFITAELELTPQQAQDFWPLYNAYRNDLQKLRRAGKQDYNPRRDADFNSRRGSDKELELSDKEWDEIMKREFTLDREKIDLDEKYYELYKTVLPVSKVAGFYIAE